MSIIIFDAAVDDDDDDDDHNNDDSASCEAKQALCVAIMIMSEPAAAGADSSAQLIKQPGPPVAGDQA